MNRCALVAFLPTSASDVFALRTKASALRAALWARGSFLALVQRRLLHLHSGTLPPRWNIWLCTANESPDGSTAQWLRRKLDMDDSNSAPLHRLGCTCRRLVDASGPNHHPSVSSWAILGLPLPNTFVVLLPPTGRQFRCARVDCI